jgi:hypothetical protein
VGGLIAKSVDLSLDIVALFLKLREFGLPVTETGVARARGYLRIS